MMKQKDLEIKEKILKTIENSNLQFGTKMELFQLLDTAFRKHLGIIFLSDKEIEDNDILNRSM